MVEVVLHEREERPNRYDNNMTVNVMIEHFFKKSVKSFKFTSDVPTVIPTVEPILTVDSPYKNRTCGEIKYGGKMLKENGCAVFCLHQGLKNRLKDDIDIAQLAHEVETKGYYEPQKGTYHNLFDHLGLRRATCVEDILIANMATVLVRNDKYLKDPDHTGHHYINVIGFSEQLAFIDDPMEGPKSILWTDLLEASLIAWMW